MTRKSNPELRVVADNSILPRELYDLKNYLNMMHSAEEGDSAIARRGFRDLLKAIKRRGIPNQTIINEIGGNFNAQMLRSILIATGLKEYLDETTGLNTK